MCDPQRVADEIRKYLEQWPNSEVAEQADIGNSKAPVKQEGGCPEGKVLVQFVGCGKVEGSSGYRWEPADTGFIEAYVDGTRFRIDLGARTGAKGEYRGLRVTTDAEHKTDGQWSNSTTIWLERAGES